MSVPLTLLGLLERGPSHGYDLKRDYDAYFGRGKPVRYSQVYATLSRLARDGKAVAGPVEQGAGPERRRFVITDEGVSDVEHWLAEPVRMRALTELKRSGGTLDLLLADHSIYRLEADLRWMDHTAARLDMLRKEVRR